MDAIYKGHHIILSNGYDPNIYHAMNVCLLGKPELGETQKPFQGREYDVCFWIHSDIAFTSRQAWSLIEKNEPIVTGWFWEGGFTSCGKQDDEFFRQHGYEFLYSEKELNELPKNERGLAEVGFASLGFTAIRKGVLESLPYPWFRPEVDLDVLGEDIAICKGFRERGYKVLVDPSIRVGHEKTRVL